MKTIMWRTVYVLLAVVILALFSTLRYDVATCFSLFAAGLVGWHRMLYRWQQNLA